MTRLFLPASVKIEPELRQNSAKYKQEPLTAGPTQS
jgi:hypothetical protein